LAVICSWAYSIGVKYSRPFGVFLVAASLASAPAAICVSYGQYALLITAALVIAAAALQRNFKLAGGLALGFCLVKPQLAALAVVLALIRRQFLTFAIACGVVLAGCGTMWALTGIDPVTAFRDSQQDAKTFSFLSVNPLTEGSCRTRLRADDLPAGAVFPGRREHRRLGCRGGSLSVLFAIAVIISMFWSYRRGYDCALLVIPMVLLFEAAARRGGTAFWAAALAFGISLWVPVRNEQWNWNLVQMLHAAAWGIGGVALMAGQLPGKPRKVLPGVEEARIQALA
jgi:hypothetical protein